MRGGMPAPVLTRRGIRVSLLILGACVLLTAYLSHVFGPVGS